MASSAAERSLARLPDKVSPAVVEFLLGPLTEAPPRVGHPPAPRARRIVVGAARRVRGSGHYGPKVEVGADASTQDRLVAFTGRDPRWRPRGRS